MPTETEAFWSNFRVMRARMRDRTPAERDDLKRWLRAWRGWGVFAPIGLLATEMKGPPDEE